MLAWDEIPAEEEDAQGGTGGDDGGSINGLGSCLSYLTKFRLSLTRGIVGGAFVGVGGLMLFSRGRLKNRT